MVVHAAALRVLDDSRRRPTDRLSIGFAGRPDADLQAASAEARVGEDDVVAERKVVGRRVSMLRKRCARVARWAVGAMSGKLAVCDRDRERAPSRRRRSDASCGSRREERSPDLENSLGNRKAKAKSAQRARREWKPKWQPKGSFRPERRSSRPKAARSRRSAKREGGPMEAKGLKPELAEARVEAKTSAHRPRDRRVEASEWRS